MRIYVKLNKKDDLWTVETREKYGGLVRTASKSLPVTRENLGATAGILYVRAIARRNAKLTPVTPQTK